MKEIRAVIRPQKLPRLREVLRGLPGFPGMTISKAVGCGATVRHAPSNIREELTDFTDKVRIEIVAPDEIADEQNRYGLGHGPQSGAAGR